MIGGRNMNTEVKMDIISSETYRRKIVRKNIILVLLGQLVSLFGSGIYSFAIALYILDKTGSGLNFSLTIVLSTLPMVILGPISGIVADRIDRKKMIVALDILSGIIVLALFGLSIADELRVIYVYGTTLLLSICSTFFGTTFLAATPNLVDDKNLTRVNSLSESISAIASISGPLLGGAIYALIDIKVFLLINGLSFVFSGISEMFIDFKARQKIYGIIDENKDNKKKGSMCKDFIEGIKYIATQKWLVALGSIAVLFNMFVIMGLTVPMAYITRKIWGFSDMQYGLLNIMFSVGMLVASIVLSILPQAKSNYKRLVTCMGIFSIGIFSVGILTSEKLFRFSNVTYLIILLIMYAIMSISSTFVDVPIGVTMQKGVPNDKLGRVYGVIVPLAQGLTPVGAIIGGVLVDNISPWILPLSCGIIIMILTIFMTHIEELKDI